MTITLVRDPDRLVRMGIEECCFCWKPTRYWSAKDVAVCPQCAEVKTLNQVPTKDEWCRQARERMSPGEASWHARFSRSLPQVTIVIKG